jgi:hypothetical protein
MHNLISGDSEKIDRLTGDLAARITALESNLNERVKANRKSIKDIEEK